MKILINGPSFQNYINMISKGFEDLNNEVIISSWPDYSRIHYLKLFAYNSLNQQGAIDRLISDIYLPYNQNLMDQIKILDPDLILTLNGNHLFPETLRYIREKTRSIHAVWCYDSVLRYPNVLANAKYFDLFYTFETSDILKLSQLKINSKFLPMAYDPYSYFDLGNQDKKIDICFIGNLNFYPARKKLFEEIISKYGDLNVQLWGKSWEWYNIFNQYEYKIKRRELKKHINNYNVSPNIINGIYNNSKICINIHHPQSKEGLNPRTFEIPGSGGFELVDHKQKLDDMFKTGKEIESYNNSKELFEKIEYYINNDKDRSRISQTGYKKAKNYHTFKNRADVILKDAESLCKH